MPVFMLLSFWLRVHVMHADSAVRQCILHYSLYFLLAYFYCFPPLNAGWVTIADA